jgi:hypothetical protein
MTLVSSGPISMGDINVELGRARTSNISLDAAENGSINANSPSKPSASNPASISEWYSYNHSATAPSIVITSYSAGNIYFTVSGTGYAPSSLTVKTSTTSSSGPWTLNTASPTSPRSVTPPTLTTWYQLEDPSRLSVVSNVYQYLKTDNTAPPSPTLTGSYNNPGRALTLSWNAVTDPSSPVTYKLYSSNVFQTNNTSTSVTLYGAWINQGSNTWTVRSVDAAGNISGNSNAYTFVAS